MATPNTHYEACALSRMLAGVRSLYFLGIGGISMSSLAMVAQGLGLRVGGYDRTATPLTQGLVEAGIPVFTTADPKHLDGYEAVVYTVAISADHPEYVEAQRRGLPLISRSNYMGYLMRSYEERIGVSGTHGKSTTTGMLWEILLAAEVEPTVLCGATLPGVGRAYSVGKTQYMAFEACEYMDSYLDFYPTTVLVLNVELDHVDYFENIEQMRESFGHFCDRVGEQGLVIGNADDDNTVAVLRNCRAKIVTFGLDREADYRATEIRCEGGKQSFSLLCRGEHLGRVTLRVGGRHNVYNALAAAAAARERGICMRSIAAGLERFGGVARRMEYKGECCGAALYDDYAHHPTEIRASLQAARSTCQGQLVCVFQPHTYSRTAALFDQFAQALSKADRVVIAPIYAARERNETGVSEASLAQAVRALGTPCEGTDDFERAAQLAQQSLGAGDTLLIMGAGDIGRLYLLLAYQPVAPDR